ncbi:desulfoferrodoxin [archaeon]|jgi:superoxide reductase|nr:desulfoferrodoxin [archaeon]MBT4023121.1 desulfoferrodoxin [archaeon]MBT4271876.1 desulfoferrodoxin [archaeon]MBT4460764.1 desulfoferrodoxin [archaeon]MBT4858821.1 desulfoferrodoxin [archaeon]
MTEKNQIYKCDKCGNIVEILDNGMGTLVCCAQPMRLFKEIEQDAGQEKHVPVVEKTQTGIIVKVGDIPHPMDEDHYIQWIEVIAKGVIYRKHLHPGDEPIAEFPIASEMFTVREYCNKHGVWKTSS